MKDNKLIAEFMGYTFVNGVYESRKDEFHIDEMLYNTSWDWLMPVIDKCYQEHMSKHIADVVMTCDIDKAYQAVVEFINQYNK